MRAIFATSEPAMRTFWYPVARSDAVESAPVARRLLDEELVLWRSNPGGPVSPVSAARDRCPHRGARLTKGDVAGAALVCPYHGWAYGPDGKCQSIPQLPAGAALPPRACLTTFACQEQWGWVWVCLEEPRMGLPTSALLPEPGSGWRVIHEPESTWDCPAFHLLDNNLDVAHIPFVHRNSFGGRPEPEAPPMAVEVHPSGFRTHVSVRVESRPGETGATVRSVEQDVLLPLLLVSRIAYPDGVVQVMVKACSPAGDRSTRQLQFVLRNDREEDRPSADIIAFDARVWKEDHELLATVWPDFPLDPRQEVHLKTDRASLEYRRQLAAVLSAGRPGSSA